MAIITTETDKIGKHGQPIPHPTRKYVSHEGIFKTDIARQGMTGWKWRARNRGARHDPRTAYQMAYRDCLKAWARTSWAYKHGHVMKNFFAVNVPRVLAGLPIEY